MRWVRTQAAALAPSGQSPIALAHIPHLAPHRARPTSRSSLHHRTSVPGGRLGARAALRLARRPRWQRACTPCRPHGAHVYTPVVQDMQTWCGSRRVDGKTQQDDAACRARWRMAHRRASWHRDDARVGESTSCSSISGWECLQHGGSSWLSEGLEEPQNTRTTMSMRALQRGHALRLAMSRRAHSWQTQRCTVSPCSRPAVAGSSMHTTHMPPSSSLPGAPAAADDPPSPEDCAAGKGADAAGAGGCGGKGAAAAPGCSPLRCAASSASNTSCMHLARASSAPSCCCCRCCCPWPTAG